VATRFARRVRPSWVALLAVLALGGILTPTLASAKPVASGHTHPQASHTRPARAPKTVAGVQKLLGRLALHDTQLVERFDRAGVQVRQREHAAAAAARVAAAARADLARADHSFTSMVQAQYETGGLGAAGALLDSQSGTNYLDRLNTMSLMSTHDADVVALVDKARRLAATKSEQAQQSLAKARRERDALARQRRSVAKQINRYKNLLGILTAQQRAAYLHASDPSVSASALERLPAAPSRAARIAVTFALHQVGKPYVFGSAGPDSFDCSGLTMSAWGAAGVHLPHSAYEQYSYGTHVPESQLEPGDLIFFYNPIGHVTIYIGDGLMVSAPTEGEDVQVVPLSFFQSDYAGATRLR
jgi:cell wall-associated NlpC family hydrolase